MTLVLASDYDAAQARIRELEAALRQIRDQGISGVGTLEIIRRALNEQTDYTPETKPLVRAESKSQQRRFEIQGIPHLPYTPETDCVHDFQRYAINNAKSPLDAPELVYTPVKCVKCGAYPPSDGVKHE